MNPNDEILKIAEALAETSKGLIPEILEKVVAEALAEPSKNLSAESLKRAEALAEPSKKLIAESLKRAEALAEPSKNLIAESLKRAEALAEPSKIPIAESLKRAEALSATSKDEFAEILSNVEPGSKPLPKEVEERLRLGGLNAYTLEMVKALYMAEGHLLLSEKDEGHAFGGIYLSGSVTLDAKTLRCYEETKDGVLASDSRFVYLLIIENGGLRLSCQRLWEHSPEENCQYVFSCEDEDGISYDSEGEDGDSYDSEGEDGDSRRQGG